MSQINDTDAAAEVGLEVAGGDTIPICSKYTYFNRRDMFFDSLGNYLGTAHPDCASTQDTAFGSFKEYWLEVSNNKLAIEPAIIRPNAGSDPRFKSGLINNYVELETERYIIKSIRLRPIILTAILRDIHIHQVKEVPTLILLLMHTECLIV